MKCTSEQSEASNQTEQLQCIVIFDKNPSKVFYVGQSLRGYVRLSVKSEQIVGGVHVKIDGKANTNWPSKHSIHQSQEECLSHQMSVLGLIFDFQLQMSVCFKNMKGSRKCLKICLVH